MKIAFTHNLKLTEAEDEAEFDTVETVESIATALAAGGHEVEKIEVSGPASHLAARIEAFAPDLIFNTAEGKRGRAREAFYPALFEELNYPYTGSDAYVLTVTLDKWLTKCVLREHGIDTPRARLVTLRDLPQIERIEGSLGVPVPAIVKPNYEGSSKGIGDDSVARDWRSLRTLLEKAVKQYPSGVLVEEFIAGSDVTVPFVEGLGDEGVMSPVEYVIDPSARSKFNIYDYRLKNTDPHKVQVRCPAELPRDVLARMKTISKTVVRTLGMRDVGRIDFRLAEDGRIYFLEVNALPSLEPGASIFAAARREGLGYEQTIAQVVKSAGVRWGLSKAEAPRKKSERTRIGFAFNMKRVDSKAGNDAEAEYDPPETIDAIRSAIESLGYEVIPLEATSELPQRLADAKVDIVFNIAEGLSGRNREAQVPALCELVGIPYTGSDSATLALALDKALAKRILRQHGILTPEFQVFASGKEKLNPALVHKFPLIVKPNAEGSSKGITGSGVVDDEPALRAAVLSMIDKYRQPALVEEYISGREFTVGLLGDKRPRILPPMEICFKDKAKSRPVYDFEIKQEWEKHVYYECPARLSPAELRSVERAARETFTALDCRDVARIDLRMNKDGQVYVLEVNPLPGLTPDYSDLVLISKAAGINYRTLIAEILAGGLKRLREKRREPRSEGRSDNKNGDGHSRTERTDKIEKIDPPKVPEAAHLIRKRLRDLGIGIGRFPTGPLNAITDVGGVRVGHTTLISGEGKLDRGKGPVRTGVTCVMPHIDVYRNRLIGGTFVLNGAGEVAGLTQVAEWGLIETPILLTNTLSVGKVADAAVKWMSKKHPAMGNDEDVVIPVVGECDDSFLNDAVGRHIHSDHVYRAIETATGGPVAEGSVGAGTGMITCDFKAGIGTSSRTIADIGLYTLGALVLTNFGLMPNLRIDGVPVGQLLMPEYDALHKRVSSYGSIIVILGTDAPLLSSQLMRLCKRAALGIGRSGSYAAHGSGEIILAFSTANKVPRVSEGMTHKIEILLDRATGPLYEAVIEATEEAIVNALCMADDMTGQGGNFAPALPLDRVVEIMRQYRPSPAAGSTS